MAAGRNILGVIEEGEDKMRSIENQLKDKLEAAKKRSEKISSLEEEIRNLETVIQPEKGVNCSLFIFCFYIVSIFCLVVLVNPLLLPKKFRYR